MASLIRSVLLEPLPVDDEDRLIVAWKRPAIESSGHHPFGADAVRAAKEHGRLFESVAAFGYNGAIQFVTVECPSMGWWFCQPPVRVALGAGVNEVRRLVLAEATRLAGLGVLLGLAVAAATSGIMRELVFGVSPIDPASLSGAVILLALTVGAACYFPLRRAARIDPIELLRAE